MTWTNDYGCELTTVPSRPVRLRWSSEGISLRFRAIGSVTPLDRATWETNELFRIG